MIPLFKFQQEALDWLKPRKRSLLRMDTGLGKTRTYLEHADNINARLVLVIAPAYLRYHWERQVRTWLEHYRAWIILTEKDAKRVVQLHRQNLAIVITSYDWYTDLKRTKLIADQQWDLVICDESHRIKNWEAIRTRHIVKVVCAKRKNIVIGTATPFTKSAKDLHPIFSLMQPGKWGKYGAFCKRYCERKYNPWTKRYEYEGVNDFFADQLKERAKEFTFTRKKRDVQKYLPKLTTQYIDIEIDESLHYEKTTNDKQKVGLEKAHPISEFLEDSFNSKDSVVIFCHHRAVADFYERRFGDAEVINGNVPIKLRQKKLDDFQSGKFSKLILTYGAGSEGIEATRASIIVHAELPWSYREMKQARDRVMRTGQKNPVTEYVFIAKDTIDERVVEVLAQKIDHEELTIGHIE